MTPEKVLLVLEQQYADTLRQGGQMVHWREVLERVERARDEIEGIVQEYQAELQERATRAIPLPVEPTTAQLQQVADGSFRVVKRLQMLRQNILARISEQDPTVEPWQP
jgi:hypothetical protein